MSPSLSDLPVRKVTKALESVGFAHVRTKGSHAVYRNREGRVAVIPLHGVVKRGTLASIRYVSSQMRHRVLLFPKLPPWADAA